MISSSKTGTADSTTASETEQISPEIVAAVVSACAAVLGGKFRLLALSQLEHVSRWTRTGRANVQASHNVRKQEIARPRKAEQGKVVVA